MLLSPQTFLPLVLTITSKMNLRKSINRPRKLQEEIAYGKKSNNPTKPAFPEKLRAQVLPFNPHLPPAAFPSLPLEANPYGEDESASTSKAAADSAESSDGQSEHLCVATVNWTVADKQLDDCHMSDVDSLPIGLYAKTRHVPTSKSPADVAFEDEMATSDDDHGDAPGKNVRQLPSIMQSGDQKHLHNQQVRNYFSGSNFGWS